MRAEGWGRGAGTWYIYGMNGACYKVLFLWLLWHFYADWSLSPVEIIDLFATQKRTPTYTHHRCKRQILLDHIIRCKSIALWSILRPLTNYVNILTRNIQLFLTGNSGRVGKARASCAGDREFGSRSGRVKPMAYQIDAWCFLAWFATFGINRLWQGLV